MARLEGVIRGVAAGLAGTAAMTVFMRPGLVGFLPPRWRPDEFVPLQVVRWMAAVAGRPLALTPEQERWLAALTHVGYGATMGGAYSVVRGRLEKIHPTAAGAAWGLAVWAFGYQGWMPSVGVRPATTHQPPSKWPVPIANHLVYGIVTAAVLEALESRRPPQTQRLRRILSRI